MKDTVEEIDIAVKRKLNLNNNNKKQKTWQKNPGYIEHYENENNNNENKTKNLRIVKEDKKPRSIAKKFYEQNHKRKIS